MLTYKDLPENEKIKKQNPQILSIKSFNNRITEDLTTKKRKT